MIPWLKRRVIKQSLVYYVEVYGYKTGNPNQNAKARASLNECPFLFVCNSVYIHSVCRGLWRDDRGSQPERQSPCIAK